MYVVIVFLLSLNVHKFAFIANLSFSFISTIPMATYLKFLFYIHLYPVNSLILNHPLFRLLLTLHYFCYHVILIEFLVIFIIITIFILFSVSHFRRCPIQQPPCHLPMTSVILVYLVLFYYLKQKETVHLFTEQMLLPSMYYFKDFEIHQIPV